MWREVPTFVLRYHNAGAAVISAMLAVLMLAVVLPGSGGVEAGTTGPADVSAFAKSGLQELIDAAADGATVTPPAGRYRGPIVISKPITIDGANGVIVDGGGTGTVVHVHTSGATIRNLRIVNSGDQHNDIDAGIRIEGNSNVVKDNSISETLFGIDLQQSHNNVVRRNRITSKADVGLGVKGDAIRLWYSRNNHLEDNTISGSRDFVIWYSSGNTIARNDISKGRYGLHFMYAKDNVIEGNSIDSNAVGIYLMYDEGDVIRGNRVVQAQGAAGVGIGLKEASNIVVEGNEILYNAVGLAFDITPFQPDSIVEIHDNTVAFNDVGVSFLSDRPGNIFSDNRFLSNTQHVAMRLFESANRATWRGNHWDDYEGFDRNRDGIGDRPYAMRSFADRLWMDVPSAAFFKGSPALSALDFIERLAPFTEPLLLLQDDRPRMSKVFTAEPLKQDAALEETAQRAVDGGVGGASQAAARHHQESQGRLDPFGLYRD